MSVIVSCILLIIIAIIAREVYVATHIQTCTYLPAICHTQHRGVLLTFDDGPDEINTIKILSLLKQHNIKAIFFCIGQKAEKHPEIVKQIVADGHLIGQHTYHHNPFRNFCTPTSYLNELKKAHQAFSQIGITIKLFRPPLGITNWMIKKAVEQMHYTTVAWSIRSFDTRAEDSNIVIDRVMRQINDESIILLHDRLNNSPEIAEGIINKTIEKGLSFCNPNTIFTQTIRE